MLPLCFGDPQQALFGIYHAADGISRPAFGVVLCHPMGCEYVSSFRTMRVLATRLAAAGMPVLRFDYYGTGDSAGAADEGSVAQWRRDVDVAIDELQATAGVTRVALVGIRFGAALAALVGAHRSDVDRMVLWEPVLEGRNQVDELRERHREWLEAESSYRDVVWSDSSDEEALGFPLQRRLADELGSVALTDLPEAAVERLLLVYHDRDSSQRERMLARLGRDVDERIREAPRFWLALQEFDRALVPTALVQEIVAWLTGVPNG